MSHTLLLGVFLCLLSIVCLPMFILFSVLEYQHKRRQRLQALVASVTGNANTDLLAQESSSYRFIQKIGRLILKTGFIDEKSLFSFSESLRINSYIGQHYLELFIGFKLILVPIGALLAWFFSYDFFKSSILHIAAPAAGAIFGLLLPDILIKQWRKTYIKNVEKGLPDALDMLVICADAGLALEAAINRVALEMKNVNTSTAREFYITAQEMNVISDRRAVFRMMADRTGLPDIRRVTNSLSQTLQVGSSITQALRVLSVEIRQNRMIEYEAKAARLPVLLTVPMILFFLPVIFITIGAPAFLKYYYTH